MAGEYGPIPMPGAQRKKGAPWERPFPFRRSSPEALAPALRRAVDEAAHRIVAAIVRRILPTDANLAPVVLLGHVDHRHGGRDLALVLLAGGPVGLIDQHFAVADQVD